MEAYVAVHTSSAADSVLSSVTVWRKYDLEEGLFQYNPHELLLRRVTRSKDPAASASWRATASKITSVWTRNPAGKDIALDFGSVKISASSLGSSPLAVRFHPAAQSSARSGKLPGRSLTLG